MKRFRKGFPIVLQMLLLAVAAPSFAAEFTQADLEQMVSELDKVIPRHATWKYPVKCSIEAKDQVNAYATLTKEGTDYRATMVVLTGLIKKCDGNAKVIRAVVAHELAHLSLGHNIDVNPAARDLNNLWTRQQEFEADKFGAEGLVKAGYEKKDMVDMLLFLERQRGRRGDWLGRLNGDHADPKARAANVSDSPSALRALEIFDIGLAYEDARAHLGAIEAFNRAAAEWPELTVAHINAAKCSLMHYYDMLPMAVRHEWWTPDFGPLIVDPDKIVSKGFEVTDEDRARYADAMKAIDKAKTANPGSDDAAELLALAQVLEPDAKKDVIQKGLDWFQSRLASPPNDILRLRYANNAGLAYQRMGDLQNAYGTIMKAQKGTTTFNRSLAENLGLVKVTGRSKDDEKLAADVLFTWLNRTPKTSPRWNTVKKTFDETCVAAGITPKPLEDRPVYLCAVMTLVTSGKELGMFMPVANFVSALGTPELRTTFTKRFPDMAEIRWNNGNVAIFTERDRAMRVTSYEPGAYLVLKPVDKTSQIQIQIKVGMKKSELFAILNEKSAVPKELARAGKVEPWLYFPELQMGVLMENDAVKAITVTPVVHEPEEE